MASGEDMEEVVVAMGKASIEAGVKDEGKKKIDRHCAFCLILVPGEEVKCCGGCKRRAYCSRECQKADWKATPNAPASSGMIRGYGQGHKNWCGLEYGEEDLDWKVVPIEGKGLGVVALRDMPHLYRIFVEGMQHPPEGIRCADPAGSSPPFHPAMNDLHPTNSDVATKFTQNSFFAVVRGLRLGLRLSRINHSCRPNSVVEVDHPAQNLAVFVLFSGREIKAGEEICRSYAVGHNFPFLFAGPTVDQVDPTYKTPVQCREEYLTKWGFVCPQSCPCRHEKNEKLLEELKEVGEYCVTNPLKKPALQKFQKIIENAKEFGLGFGYTSNMYLVAIELAVARRETLEEAKKHLQTIRDIMVAILHPKVFSQFKDSWMLTDISNHPKYLAAER